MIARFILLLAQGCGVGRIRFAPGTFGSILGLGWFAVLISTGKVWLFFAGMLVAAIAAVWICGRAEEMLGQTDPGSVVLDEIIAIPLCFTGMILSDLMRTGTFPGLLSFFGQQTWWKTAAIFALFRFFDVVKPSPVRQLQRLPGGWGVTIDDVAAAIYVNAVQIPFLV